MKNSGFTLVELLAVIVLIIIMSILIFPNVRNIISSSKDTTYQKQINTILSAAYDWSLKNSNDLPTHHNKKFITLSQLKSVGLLDANIQNPKNKEKFSDDLVVSINNTGNNYKSTSKYSKSRGDYLYTVEIDLMDSLDYKNKKPIIELIGLTSDSEGNYVTIIDINSIYNDVNYTATSNKGEDLTSTVVVNIIKNDKLVEEVDTSKIGIYYISYTVVDSEGYSNVVTRSVIVSDNQKPIIELPTSNTISTSITDFNLMEGVSCIDNSGSCEITIKGEINFGIRGKYVIEYTAKDPSGNTSTKKRIVTIE